MRHGIAALALVAAVAATGCGSESTESRPDTTPQDDDAVTYNIDWSNDRDFIHPAIKQD